MTSNATAAAAEKDTISISTFGTHFVPKDLRSLIYSKETLMVYPKLTRTMPLSEKAHAFNVNRLAVEASSLSSHQRIQLMGSLHNQETVVSIMLHKWEEFIFENSRKKENMTVISYNGADGKVIPSWADAAGALKPLQDGSVAD